MHLECFAIGNMKECFSSPYQWMVSGLKECPTAST